MQYSFLQTMAVLARELKEGSSLLVFIYLKGDPLEIEGLLRIGGTARIDEPGWKPSLLKGGGVKIEEPGHVTNK